MSEMRQYVCWTDRAVVEVTPRDASSLGSGQFQAVHHPLRLQQRPLGTRSGGSWVEETDIARTLMGPVRPDGYLLLPVVGASGTGKSHLVRWVWSHIKDRANWEIRYLAKNRTSIRGVIEDVIKGLEGPAIDAAREALQTAPAQSESEPILAERLLDELALIIGAESATGTDVADRKAAQMEAKLRRELPDILRDPVVRRRLTADRAVIPRLIGLAKRGRSDGDGLDDDAIRIVDSDLPLTFTEIGEASRGAQKLLNQLAVIPDLKSAAVCMLNDALPTAVKRVFLSGQVNLIEVFREVRRELLRSGKELVLFIEDLTVLHGVEREFLDAIIEPARSLDGDLCVLRVLFAVTEGHFDGLDTVRTRCDDAYWLDAPYGSDGVGHDEAISFLGRYLNACRQDTADVQNLWDNRQSNAWMPNACDACDHQVHCHETFGRSEEGYGLYPYNPAAVDRFVGSLSDEGFDPRQVVRQLVNRFLIIAATDLEHGYFPSDRLVEPFDERSEPIDPLVQAGLRSRYPADFSRIVNSMRYWSESSTLVGDATLTAFGLDELGALDGMPRPRPKPKDPPTANGTVASRLRPQWSRIFDELSAWVGNQQSLRATSTNELKKLVRESILINLDFSALPINLGASFDEQKRFDHQIHIYIAGSVTDQSRRDPLVKIEQDADTAAALQGLILLAELPDAQDYREADDYRRHAAQYLEEWTLRVATRIEQTSESELSQAITGLLVCSAVVGACQGASDPRDFLAALFGSTKTDVGSYRSDKWQAVVKEAGVTHRRLRPIVEANFGEARGKGATRAIRADQVLSVIQDFTKSGRLDSPDPAIARFMQSVTLAMEVEWEALEYLATGAAPFVDPNLSWSSQKKRVLDLVEAAHRAGRLRDQDAARDLRDIAASLDNGSHKHLLRAVELLRQDHTPIERLQLVASRLPDRVVTMSRFVTRAQQAIVGIEKDLDERRARQPETETLEDVASGVVASVSRLAEAIAELET